MTTTSGDDEPLHKAWWESLSRLCSFQAEKCGCWENHCGQCFPLAEELRRHEEVLRAAGEWK